MSAGSSTDSGRAGVDDAEACGRSKVGGAKEEDEGSAVGRKPARRSASRPASMDVRRALSSRSLLGIR